MNAISRSPELSRVICNRTSQATTREVALFARSVRFHLKTNSAAEFTKTIDNEIVPLLRKQKDSPDEITFVVPVGTEAVGITLWDQKENVEAYNRGTYPQVLRTQAKVVERTPRFKTYEVSNSNSTFHKIAAHVGA